MSTYECIRVCVCRYIPQNLVSQKEIAKELTLEFKLSVGLHIFLKLF